MGLLRLIAWVFLKLLLAMLKMLLRPFELLFALDFKKRHPRIVAAGNWVIGKVFLIQRVMDVLARTIRW